MRDLLAVFFATLRHDHVLIEWMHRADREEREVQNVERTRGQEGIVGNGIARQDCGADAF